MSAPSPSPPERIELEGPAIELTPTLTAVAPITKPGTLTFVVQTGADPEATTPFLLLDTTSPEHTAELLLALSRLAATTMPAAAADADATADPVDARIAQGRQAHARTVARPGETVHPSGLIVP